ncbi:uncharacterized protein APUU_80570S [Aspergillus puulaauensis]|uniref:Uncharacterized protein n=1 Tax=Aspergillus puulaauensis TaxID=1220207 RepID=A0A7R8ATJ6_9EURO|nr:uncharacterized protein APUU_80570S [Aspergillus puulaauensis]BCS30267.1 hypothetical protein APUU_80570S [Aspergillus puulaauensis]
MHFSALSLGLMFLLAAAHAHPSSPVGATRFAKRQGKDLGNSACVGACVKAPETLDCGKNIQFRPHQGCYICCYSDAREGGVPVTTADRGAGRF